MVRLVLVLERKTAASRKQLVIAVSQALPTPAVVGVRTGTQRHELLNASVVVTAETAEQAVGDVRAAVVDACQASGRRVGSVRDNVTRAGANPLRPLAERAVSL